MTAAAALHPIGHGIETLVVLLGRRGEKTVLGATLVEQRDCLTVASFRHVVLLVALSIFVTHVVCSVLASSTAGHRGLRRRANATKGRPFARPRTASILRGR